MKPTLLSLNELILSACALMCPSATFGQGTVIFNNHIAGALVTHVYLPSPDPPLRPASGNGPNDLPAGTTDWTGYTPVSGSGFSAQLWAAEGKDRPECALQPATPITTFRSGVAAGFVVGTTATLTGVESGAAAATIVMRVWDNQGGTVTSWAQAIADRTNLHGESPYFNVSNIGAASGGTPPPVLVGLQSFSIGGLWVDALGCPQLGGWRVQPTNRVVTKGGTAAFNAEALLVMNCPYPLCPRWYHDGTPIGDAGPSCLFLVTNAQPEDAGNYWAEVSLETSCGCCPWVTNYTATSAVATLTVLAPPVITSNPNSQTAEAGASVRLRCTVDGSAPLSYAWFFNGTNAVAAPMADGTLLFTHVQRAQAGTYTVMVTNAAGAVTSAPAMLQVVTPVERRPALAVKATGETGSQVTVDYADSLSPTPAWTLLGSVRLSTTSQCCLDVASPLPPQRFYRAWQAGIPAVVPSLEPPCLVPAITLTGNIGDKLRLDYINQFGPTDAWITLDTVTLTNTSQFYFDVSAPGQPQRLYRLVQLP